MRKLLVSHTPATVHGVVFDFLFRPGSNVRGVHIRVQKNSIFIRSAV